MTIAKKGSKTSKSGMLENVMQQFEAASQLIGLNPNIKKILSVPNNELIINFPVRMDNGNIEMFKGYRVQHNNALGPYKGGFRYHPTIDTDAVKALAMWMTWKTSLAGLPYGGAKGGIQMDPKKYSISELERITRRFTYALGDNIGPEHDIAAPDVNTNAQTMAWIADTYMSTKAPSERSKNRHVVTGKPVGSGGLEGRDRATGFGVFLTIKLWMQNKNVDLKDKTFIVQGFGNVGYWASHFLQEVGAKLVGIQDAFGSITNPKGIEVEALFNYVSTNDGSIVRFKDADSIADDQFFGLKCDICIPAALGDQISGAEAGQIQAFLVAEGANGPTTMEGEKILVERGIEVIPDILCNSGGVIASYFEWLQNRNGELWAFDEIMIKIEKRISDSFGRVYETAQDQNINLRSAAYMIAISRIERAYIERGIFP